MEKIIGTHNSMTYLRPTKWWMRMLNVFAKCQCYDIDTQFENDARCFDIRVSYNWRTSKWEFRHGLIVYSFNDLEKDKKPIDYTLDTIAQLGEKYDTTPIVRLILEKTKDEKTESYMFPLLCKDVEDTYKDKIIFIGGYRKKDWERLYKFPKEDEITTTQFVSSMAEDALPCEKLLPFLYAKHSNKYNRKQLKEGVNLFDFIGKY